MTEEKVMLSKLMAVLGTFGLSFSSIFVRFSDTDSIIPAFYRMVFTVLILAPLILLKYRKEYTQIKASEFLLCAFGGFCFGMHLRCAFLAFSLTGIAAATVLVNTEVFFVAIGSFFIEGERISILQGAGMSAAFFGSVLIAGTDAGSSSSMLAGDVFALLGALFSSAYTLVGRRCRKHLSTTAYTGIVYLFAMFTLAVSMKAGNIPFTGFAPYNLLLALGLAVICTLLGHSIFSWCLKYESAAYVSLVKLLEPVFATIMGFIFFGELPAAATVLGGMVVIGGIVLYISGTNTKSQGELSP